MTVDNPNSQASGEGTPDSVNEGGGTKTEFVPLENHRKLLSEKKGLQAKFADQNAELARYKADEEARNLKDQTDRGEFDKILASSNEKIASLTGELENSRKQTNDFVKTTAFLQGLGGKLDSKYYGHIPLDSIEVGEEGINPESLTKAVSTFRETHPMLILDRKSDLPANKTGSSSAGLTVDQWEKLGDTKEMERRFGEVDWDAHYAKK